MKPDGSLEKLLSICFVDLHWEYWQYSFARALCLSGHDQNGKCAALLFELTHYINMPFRMTNPKFFIPSEEEVKNVFERLSRRYDNRYLKNNLLLIIEKQKYYICAEKLTIILEDDYPDEDIQESILEEIYRLERESFPI